MPVLHRLKKRAGFLAAAKEDRHVATKGLVLQARLRKAEEPHTTPKAIRLGFTATKRLGNAVQRNRVKRRLRALAQHLGTQSSLLKPGFDYVLIGRIHTASRPFAALEKDLRYALHHIHAPKPAS